MPRGNEDFDYYIRTRSVRPPKTLYKYTTADTARKVLMTRKLLHQSPLRYNDPFDSQWDPLWFEQTPGYVEKERALLDRALRERDTWPSDMDPKFRIALDAEASRINALPDIERNRELELFLRESTAPQE